MDFEIDNQLFIPKSLCNIKGEKNVTKQQNFKEGEISMRNQSRFINQESSPMRPKTSL